MRVSTVAVLLCTGLLLGGKLTSSQPLTGKLEKPPLVGRIEIDEHEKCFTVRVFIANATDKEIPVTCGIGDKGLEILPFFNFGEGDHRIYMSPPTYLTRPKQVLPKPSILPIPAGKEILYGTFTMGYPRLEKETVDDLHTTINIRQPDTIVEAKPVRLKIPAHNAVGSAEQNLDAPGQWVNSDNGELSLRLRVKSARMATKDSIVAIAEIRNNRPGPATILRPFGGFAKGAQLKIWGEQGQIKYTGPKLDYDLSAKAFVTLGANEVVSDTLELSVHDFARTDKAGAYTLRYDYSYSGDWDKKVASEGVKEIWHGAMCSREIQLQKK